MSFTPLFFHRASLGPVLLACLSCVPLLPAQDVVEKWNVRYDGTTDGVHQGRAVAVDAAGNVVVTGPSAGANGFDFYTVKYNAATGAVLWSDRYDGTGDGDDVPVAVAVDGEGHVIVTGSSFSGTNGLDVQTRKYNGATGGDLWNKRDDGGGNGDDAATAIALDAAGNVIVTGSATVIGNGLDFYTAKYASANGALLWSRRYNGTGDGDDVAAAVAVDAAGSVVVTGTSRGNGSKDFYTAKYDGVTDTIIWDESYNGPGGGEDEATAVAVDAAGNVIVTGVSQNNGNKDLYTVKYAAADGDKLWDNRQNGNGNGDDRANDVAVDADGNVVITGYSEGTQNLDFYVAKYAAADGKEIWSDRYNGPGNGDDAGTSVAVDPQGNVIVTGTSEGTNNTQDFYTACHDGRTGERLWFKRFDGPRGREELVFPFGLALGPQNSVAITGATQMTSPPLPEYDFITLLYTADLTDADADGLLDTWETSQWGTTVGHGPSDDADQDGVVELLEYAFGMDPQLSEPSKIPEAVIEDGFLTITLTKRAGVSFVVESSGTLATGSWSTASTVVMTDTAGTLKVRDTVPTSAGQSRFLRVRVTAP
jgi:uncharacterized delta-60 repeat protein